MTVTRAAALALALAVIFPPLHPTAQSASTPIFRFSTDEFWLNLHHFLYVLGRAQARTLDAGREAVAGAPEDAARGTTALSDDDRRIWTEAVAVYTSGVSRKDIVFDSPLPAITQSLADAGERLQAPELSDAVLRATLERAAPIYRKAWWPAHRADNVAWRDGLQTLVDRHGRDVLSFITRAYGMPWPAAGYPVHLSAYTNWAGAYSTDGNLLVVSSRSRGTRGLSGLETVFHEGMHQWDDAIGRLLGDAARRAQKRLPPNVSHAMVFFTAGEAVRHVAPDHVPVADSEGVWQRGLQRFKPVLEDVWKPYLDGRGTRDDAIAAIIARF